MSWTNELYQVYENNCGNDDEETVLLPVSHSTANAQIEVIIKENGEFADAERINDKNDSVTIIPVTEDSGSRSSGIAPHPLEDKLIYIAGDYSKYITGKRADNTKYYQAYLKQLENWKESEYTHPALHAIYTYLSRGCLMEDLIKKKVLLLDDTTGKLKEKEKILGIAQEDCFVRFRIEYQKMLETESRVWKDKSLYQSFIAFNSSIAGKKQLCYATGENLPCTYKHPSKIRNAGDKAKLISSNDESGFSYRGRFDSKEQALSVSYDFSQKMHNALKWLIAKQGIAIGPMMLLMWESNLQKLPDILREPIQDWDDDWDDLSDLLFDHDSEEKKLNSDVVSGYRKKLQQAIWGDAGCPDIKSKAMVMILDAATTGRLSIALYEEMQTSDLYRNIEKWHLDTSWIRYNFKKNQRRMQSFSLYEIAECAFGLEQGDFISCKQEVKNETILRLIPCVINGQKIPVDIVRNLVQKASKPLSYKKTYNWNKVLETACGMIHRTLMEQSKTGREEFGMALNHECRDRDYLYGRLLAIAEAVETTALKNINAEGRTTNAHRYFEMFSNRPYRTWGGLYNRLMPYLNRMKSGQRVYYEKLIGEIMEMFQPDDFKNDAKLQPEFLLAYHCQLNEIYTKKDTSKEEK